jgi:ubiquitin carboxyl-terminal hydrolase L3
VQRRGAKVYGQASTSTLHHTKKLTYCVEPDSLLKRLFSACAPLGPSDRAFVLEGSEELEELYAALAMEGDSAVPENAEDEVDFHYVCFVKSDKTGLVYDMDGDCKGPRNRGPAGGEGEDMLSERVLDIVREFIQLESGENLGFNLMALAQSDHNEGRR